MKHTSENKFHFFIYIIIFISIIIVIISSLCKTHINTLYDNEECITFNANWKYVDKNNQTEFFNLPFHAEEEPYENYEISNYLPTTVNGYYFAKFCVFTDYTLFIDNELIYDSRNEMQENMETHKNEGKYWSIIRLPDNCSGKSIKIVNYSKYPEYQPTFGNIYIGTKSAILFTILNKETKEIIISICCFLLGLYLFLFYLISMYYKRVNQYYFIIGNILSWCSLWIFVESSYTQFFISNASFTIIISFISSQLCLLFFAIFINLQLPLKNHLFEHLLIILLSLQIIISGLLQIFGIAEYYQTRYPFYCLVIIVVLFMMYKLIYYSLVKKEHLNIIITLPLCITCIAATYEIIYFTINDTFSLGNTFIPCCGIISLVIGFTELVRTQKYIYLGYKAKYYEKLAEYDYMTETKNRTAYLQYIQSLNFNKFNLQSLVVIVCDIDHLKQINDTLGHREGDKSIVLCSSILTSVFGNHGTIYRIGGDEFTIILQNIEEDFLQCLLKEYYSQMSLHETQHAYKFTASIGYSCYYETDKSFDDIFKRADRNMYKEKSIHKSLDYHIKQLTN